MTHGKKNLQILLTGVVVAFAVMAPSAQASELKVCNQATDTFTGGDLVAVQGETGPSVRNTLDLKALPGRGAGLLGAAENSRALQACYLPDGSSGGENGYSYES